MYYMEIIFKLNKMLSDVDFIKANSSIAMFNINNWQNIFFLW